MRNELWQKLSNFKDLHNNFFSCKDGILDGFLALISFSSMQRLWYRSLFYCNLIDETKIKEKQFSINFCFLFSIPIICFQLEEVEYFSLQYFLMLNARSKTWQWHYWKYLYKILFFKVKRFMLKTHYIFNKFSLTWLTPASPPALPTACLWIDTWYWALDYPVLNWK